MKYIKTYEGIKSGSNLIEAIKSESNLSNIRKLIKTEDVNYEDHMSWTPLLWATYFEKPKVIRMLIDAGANMEHKALHHIAGSRRMVDFYDLTVDKDYKGLQKWIEENYPEFIVAKKYNV